MSLSRLTVLRDGNVYFPQHWLPKSLGHVQNKGSNAFWLATIGLVAIGAYALRPRGRAAYPAYRR